MPTVESQRIRLKVMFLAESDRGYTISNQNARTWLPRRLCQIDPAGSPVGELCHATMPDWLAKESGLLGPVGIEGKLAPHASISRSVSDPPRT